MLLSSHRIRPKSYPCQFLNSYLEECCKNSRKTQPAKFVVTPCRHQIQQGIIYYMIYDTLRCSDFQNLLAELSIEWIMIYSVQQTFYHDGCIGFHCQKQIIDCCFLLSLSKVQYSEIYVSVISIITIRQSNFLCFDSLELPDMKYRVKRLD